MSHTPWLTSQCMRHISGTCTTRACLIRGGWTGQVPVDLTLATCEPHEILSKLAAVKADLEVARDAESPGDMLDGINAALAVLAHG